MSAAPPASIVVRSTGRPVLAEALAVIAAQTYPAIEVVLVDASGHPPPVAATCGPFPIVFVAASAAALLSRCPCHVGALSLAGTLHALQGDYEEAARRFRLAVDESPEDAGTQSNLAQALGRSDEVRERYRRTLELEPGHAHARARLAALEARLERTKP